MTKRMATIDGSNVITNVAVWDGVQAWSPSASGVDITGRINLGRGHTYVALPPSRTYNIVIDGNSIADANLLTSRAVEDAVVEAGLTTDDFINVAASARTTTGLIDLAPTQVDQLFDANYQGKNICIFWELSNDFALRGLTDVQAYSNLKTYCQGRKASGWKVIVGTCLPRTDVSIETYRTSVNSMILTAKANAETWLDEVADVGSHATMGDVATCANTTYYSDGVHPTNAGQDLLRPIFTAAIQAAL